MADFDAVLFDFDGVLADTEPVHFSCWRDVAAHHNIALDWQTYCRVAIGLADRQLVAALARLRTPPADPDELWSDYPRKLALFRDRVLTQGVISRDAVALLRSLDAYGIAVVTSSAREEVEPVLEAAGVRRLVDVLICSGDVTETKPSPEPYRRAAEALRANRPLVVEDSDAGAASAAAAGYAVLRVGDCAAMPALVRAALGLGPAPP